MPRVVFIIVSTLIAVFLLFLLISFIANMVFNHKSTEEIEMLFASNDGDSKQIISNSDLKGLPNCVRQWLHYSGLIGKEKISTARLKQKAVMRLEKNKSWMPVEAEQYFTVDKPGFIWKAKIKAAPFFHIVGRDKYYDGKGNMLIKLLSLITIADSKGREIDQGTMVRFMAESVWFPTAALSDYLEWEEIDSRTAKATMNYKGVTASGLFKFNEKGEVINFSAERYRETDGKYSLELWSITMDNYKEFEGVKIPAEGEVTWKLDSGDFTWFKFEIPEVEFNKPAVY